ncbi:MAG: hypothetical protein Q9227_002005 [Pyrenula ochraceoflavens]
MRSDPPPLAPSHTFSIRTSPAPFWSKKLWWNPLLSTPECITIQSDQDVPEVFAFEDEKELSKARPQPEFYVSLRPQPLLWLFRPLLANPILGLHAGTPNQTSLVRPPRLLDLELQQSLIDPMMCTVGTCAEATQSHQLSPKHATSMCSGIGPDLVLHSGLGHGEWFDPVLAKILGRQKISWAANSGNRLIEFPVDGSGAQEAKMLWEQLAGQRPQRGRGCLALIGDGEDLLAVYVPRSSNPGCDRYGLRFPRQDIICEKGEDGLVGDGQGRLGLVGEEWTDRAIKHAMLVCVAIEESIRQSRGWTGVYHGHWAY